METLYLIRFLLIVGACIGFFQLIIWLFVKNYDSFIQPLLASLPRIDTTDTSSCEETTEYCEWCQNTGYEKVDLYRSVRCSHCERSKTATNCEYCHNTGFDQGYDFCGGGRCSHCDLGRNWGKWTNIKVCSFSHVPFYHWTYASVDFLNVLVAFVLWGVCALFVFLCTVLCAF